jgi:hypothetical protein
MTALDIRQEYVMEDEVEWLSRSEYQDRHGKSESTMQRALREGRVPGAEKNAHGEWLIPADAPILRKPPEGTAVVRQTPPAVPVTVSDVPQTYPMGTSGTLQAVLDTLPAFLDVATAARLLGIPAQLIRENADDFDARAWGRRAGGRHSSDERTRALVIPQATIRRFAGL